MFKQIKNLVLYDIPPNEDEFLAKPVSNLKKLLLDKNSMKQGSTLRLSEVDSRRYSFPSSSSSVESILDDGNTYGLGNPKILRSILINLPISDLLLARQVNLRWNAVACSVLRSKFFHAKVPPSKLKQFLKLMRSNISNPFSSYAIRVDEIMEKNIQQFFTQFSLKIVRLRVRLNISELPSFSKVLQKMKHLKDLHIIIFDEYSNNNNTFAEEKSSSYLHLPSIRGYHWNSLKVSDEHGAWEQGLYSFPSIRTLLLESFDESYKIHPFYDQTAANIVTACVNLQKMYFQRWNSPLGQILSKLEITIPGILDCGRGKLSADDIINLFFFLNLRFHEVTLEVTSEITWELLQDVIHKSSETLRELTVVNDNIFEKFYLTSALRQLVKLSLSYWSGPLDFSYFRKQFPALRHISLNLSNLYEIETGLVGLCCIEPCYSLKTLTLTRLEVGIDVGLMEKLSIIFPDVKEIFVEVKSGKVLEKIYEVYPELLVLCVELNNDEESDIPSMTNQSFTGIPDEAIKIVEEKACGCPELDFSEDVRSCWNIGCLKDLKTLLIRVPSSVNNIALLEGISRLENLQNLVLLPLYYNGEEPTKWCVRSIADNFYRLKTLVTSSEIQYDDSELSYLRSKMPKLVHKKRQ